MMIWYNVSVREKIYHISHFRRNYHIINILMAGRYRSARAYLPAIYQSLSILLCQLYAYLKHIVMIVFSLVDNKKG